MHRVRHGDGLIKLVLPRDLRDRIIADARHTPTLEICGLLAGRGTRCTAAYPVRNISPEPATAFYMDPQEQIDAMGMMQASGEEMLGIYHSHPRTDAWPSARDIAGAAYPGVACVIISLKDSAAIEVAAFDLAAGELTPIPLEIA